MKLSASLKAIFVLVLAPQLLFAIDLKNESQFVILNQENPIEANSNALLEACCKGCGSFRRNKGLKKKPATCQLGVAIFGVTDNSLWYPINTLVYPQTVPLSLNRNLGSTKGDVQLTPTGLLIGEEGDYSVNYSVTLFNQQNGYTPLIVTFLVINDVFNPFDNNSAIGSIGGIFYEAPTVIQASGILQDVPAGSTLSIIASNTGSPQPEPVSVISWSISAFKIPCESPSKKCRRKK